MRQCEMDHMVKYVMRGTLFVIVLSALILLLLSGCSWIESDAGKARYSYTVTFPDGTEHRIDLQNAKDVGEVMAEVYYGDVRVTLYEKGVNASSPMAVMAETQAKMIDAILAPVP